MSRGIYMKRATPVSWLICFNGKGIFITWTRNPKTMEKHSSPDRGLEDKCLQCRGCIDCDEIHCLFHAQGNPDGCFMDRCKYCVDFLKKQRLYLNNVG